MGGGGGGIGGTRGIGGGGGGEHGGGLIGHGGGRDIGHIDHFGDRGHEFRGEDFRGHRDFDIIRGAPWRFQVLGPRIWDGILGDYLPFDIDYYDDLLLRSPASICLLYPELCRHRLPLGLGRRRLLEEELLLGRRGRHHHFL